MKGVLIGFIAACVAATSVACVALHYYAYGLIGLWSIAGIIAAFPLCVLLHELGHFVFGLFSGIRAVPKFSVLGSSSCKIIPRTDKNLKARVIVTAAGGLIVNYLFVVLGIISFAVPAIPIWLSVALPSSTYLFILNAAGQNLPDGKTDGQIIAELIRGEDSARVMLAVLTVQAQVLKGKRIEEVDEKLLFGLPVIREDDPAFISLTQLRYEYFKAKGDTEQAEIYKKRFEQLKEYL